MFKHQVALFFIVLCSSLALTGVASAHYEDGYRSVRSPHPYMYASPDTYVSCHKMYVKTVDGKVVKRHFCKVYGAGFACKEYVFFVSPNHTDKMCTKWEWVHKDHYYGAYDRVR